MTLPPVILFQTPPVNIPLNYNIRLPSTEQSPSSGIPQTYIDSQTVLENVFIAEQNAVPVKYQQDSDDTCPYCWLLYSSFPAVNLLKESVLFRSHIILILLLAQGLKLRMKNPPISFRLCCLNALTGVCCGRKTSLHDGAESYIRFGLCVVKEERGRYLQTSWCTALDWARGNAREFGKGVMEKLPVWKGLVCVHAQEKVLGVWERHGFIVDEGMGSWFEGGIRHVGMFRRLAMEGQ